jgi:hypothetical protein
MEEAMKTKIRQLVAGPLRVQQQLRHAMLLPIAALMSQPSFAALPTIVTPQTGVGGAAVQQGDWIGIIGAIFVALVAVAVLILCAWFFIQGIMGLITKWKDYSGGRATIGDLKEYFVMVIISSVVAVLLGGYALTTMS